jgi:hypothetical protein
MRNFAGDTPSAARARPDHKIQSSLAAGGQGLELNWPQPLYTEKKNKVCDSEQGSKRAKEKWQHDCLEQACTTMKELSKKKKRGIILFSNTAASAA